MSITSDDLDCNIELDEWDCKFPHYTTKTTPSTLYPRCIQPFAAIISSGRNQGKSVLLKDMYRRAWKGKFDIVVLFSNTVGNGFYDKFLPEDYIRSSTYDEELLLNLYDSLEEYKEIHGKYLNTLVLFDDCIDKSQLHSKPLTDIFTLGRHRGVSICFITQTPTLVSTVWRSNITHMFNLYTRGPSKAHIINNFITEIIDDSEIGSCSLTEYANKILKATYRKKYRVLVIEFEKNGTCLKDNAKWFIADP